MTYGCMHLLHTMEWTLVLIQRLGLYYNGEIILLFDYLSITYKAIGAIVGDQLHLIYHDTYLLFCVR